MPRVGAWAGIRHRPAAGRCALGDVHSGAVGDDACAIRVQVAMHGPTGRAPGGSWPASIGAR